MQLTLENKKVKAATKEYEKELVGILKGKKDVIGCVVAINGELNSADIYHSNNLFRKLWPKLLKSVSVEAVAEKTDDSVGKDPTEKQIRAWMQKTESSRATDKQINRRISMRTRESSNGVLFETRDKKNRGQWIHRNYLAK